MRLSLFGGFACLGGKCVVFLTDLVELLHVLLEIRAFLQCDEQLGLLAIPSIALHSDCLGLNFLERGIIVSKKHTRINI